MPKIEKMYAFVVADKDENDEGVIGIMKNHQWMPLVGADMDRVKILIPAAQETCNLLQKPVTIFEFSVRKHINTLFPGDI